MQNYGSIYLRKDGYYYGRVAYNKIRKTFYGKDEQVVQDKMNDWVLQMKYNNVSSSNNLIFSKYCEKYLYTYKRGFIKDSSFDRLDSILNKHICGSSIDIPVYELDDVLVQSFLNEKRVYSSSTIKKVYDLVRLVLFYAYRKKDIELDIAGMLILPKSIKKIKSIDVYSDDEIKILENSIKDILANSSDHKELSLFRYSVSYIIILNTGLRAGEMLALTWDDVDLLHNCVRVTKSLNRYKERSASGSSYVNVIGAVKTDKSIRNIPLNKAARECFVYLKLNSSCEYVVDNKKDSFLLLNSYQQTFKRICEYIGIKHKGLHALRHTFASRLIRKGAPVKVVSDLLGHTSVVFTLNRYVHSYDDDVSDAVRLLDDTVFIAPPEL